MARKAIKSSWTMGVFVSATLFVLAFACATPAFAASGSLKVVSEESHSYQIYRLFTCDVDADGSISDVSTDSCMPAGFYGEAFPSMRAQEMAEEVSRQVNGAQASGYVAVLSKTAVKYGAGAAVAECETGVEVFLETGIYLLVSHDAQPILVTVGQSGIAVDEKSTLPSVTKEIASVQADDIQSSAVSFGQAAATGASQQVIFRVTGILPSNYEAFDTYHFAFVDTPSEGISLDLASVAVALVDEQGLQMEISQGYIVTYEQGVLRVAFDDLKRSIPEAGLGSKIVLTYRGALNPADAKYGFEQGNPNSVVVEYRRSPSFEELGTTKPGVAKAYSFVLRLEKVDCSDVQEPLSGASFELRDDQGNIVNSASTNDEGLLEFSGIAPGEYQLVETVAPSGYRMLDQPVAVEITTDTQALSLAASVTSASAELVQVDAHNGVVTVSIANAQLGSGIFAQMGDGAIGAIAGLFAAVIVAIAVILVAATQKRPRDGRAKW